MYILDISLVALAIYFILLFVKQTRSYPLIFTLGLYIGVSLLARIFDLVLTRELLQILATFFIFIFIIVFQREIRRFFDWIFISSRRLTGNKINSLSNEVSFAITKAAEEMAGKNIGALIVFPGEMPLEGLIEGGFPLDGKVSVPLLLSIFDTSSPGHDGAVIIDHNRIRRFGVHLPLAENFKNFASAGTRHRAGVGVTERSDSLAIIISEERGEISVAQKGELKQLKDMTELDDVIRQFVKTGTAIPEASFARYFFSENLILKLIALIIAIGLWFVV